MSGESAKRQFGERTGSTYFNDYARPGEFVAKKTDLSSRDAEDIHCPQAEAARVDESRMANR